jgi:hypothetical protein
MTTHGADDHDNHNDSNNKALNNAKAKPKPKRKGKDKRRNSRNKVTPTEEKDVEAGNNDDSDEDEDEDELKVKPKDLIVQQITQDVDDITDFEKYSAFHSLFCRCCFITNLFGLLILLYACGVTPVFKSVAPRGARLLIAFGASACFFLPCVAWTC